MKRLLASRLEEPGQDRHRRRYPCRDPHRDLGPRCWNRRAQGGAALVTVLFLMLALLTVTVSSMRGTLSAARSARAEGDRLVAHAAAEAALLDAEADIDGAAGPASARSAVFKGPDAEAFMPGCAGLGEREGLCRPALPPAAPVWQSADLAGEAGVAYGRFTGRMLPLGAGPLPARAPRYLIELLAGPDGKPVYRITAIGFGTDAATIVVLQSYYRRAGMAGPGGGPPPPGGGAADVGGKAGNGGSGDTGNGNGDANGNGNDGPGGEGGASGPGKRVGRREVGNWLELHRSAS